MGLKDKIFLFLLFLLAVVIVSPFFSPGFPNTHDGQTHVVRLAAFHQALSDGQFPPRWAGNLAFGFGSSVLSFNFPLSYFLGEIFHLSGFSFEDSIKCVFFIATVFSGMAMYGFLRQTLTSSISFLGGALYLLAPYRFLDLYVRGEIGESLMFIFPPLILLTLSKLKEKISWAKIFFAAALVCLMILSHQSLAFAFLAMIVSYSLVMFYPKKRPMTTVLLIIFLGMSLAAFNLFPLFLERQYTNLDRLIQTNYRNQFPAISSLFYSKWSWGPADTGNP
ncbi:MAG: 6-pyruvoyl-tetrahydropterin synthase-related protein, partial [bacterium]|nr:6-pyruvoyl-tetrahydropterin synthase-related protein [bacterium]